MTAGPPAPTVTDRYPPPIVKWRISPGCVVDPCPTPRSDPPPLTIPIRRPAGGNNAWNPHVAVVGVGDPLAVEVELFVTRHVRRHIARRLDVAIALVSRDCPLIERCRRGLFVIQSRQARAYNQRLSARDIDRVGAVHDTAPAAEYRKTSLTAIFSGVDPIAPRCG